MKHLSHCLLLLTIFLLLFPARKARAHEVYGNIDAFYQTTKNSMADGTEETTWNLSQGYMAGYRNAINQNMNYLFDFRAIKNETDIQETKSLYNTGTFNVTNDLFNGNLGYQLADMNPSNAPRLSSNSWNLNLNSNLEKVPEVRLQYSEDRKQDHLDVHETDNVSRQLATGIQYEYMFMNAMFNYNQGENENLVQDTVLDTNGYSGKLDLSKSFFGNKLFFNNDFDWSRNTSRLTYKSDITLLEPRNIEQGLYLYDALPVLDEMDERESLTDGDYTTGTEIDIGSTGDINHNIGVDLGTSQECETIYLYTTDNYDPALSNAFFSWAVYYSDDGTNWNLVTSNAFFDYNTVYYRFEIEFPSQEARYLKAVNTHYDGRSFVGSTYITEIEILGSEDRRKEEVNKTTSSRWGNNFAVTLNPSKKLTLGYNFSCDYAESDPGSNLETKETSQLTHGTNISYLFHRYFSSSAQYGKSTRISDENRSENNSISLQFNSSPLDTLNTSLSFNHSESETENDEDEEEEEKVKSESNSCLYFLGAELWKGVDFGSNYNHTRNKSSAGTETMGHTINLDLRTKLTQNVTMESGYSHNWQKDENAEDEAGGWIEGSSVSAKLRYSPSDIFFLGSDYMYNKSEEGSDSAYGFNINWLPGEKIQLSFNSRYKLSESEQSNDKNLTCSLDASWNISRHIIFKNGYSYTKNKGKRNDKTQTFYTRLSARF